MVAFAPRAKRGRHGNRFGEIIAAMGSLSVIWGIALSVLGVNAVKRSQDKRLAAGQTADPGILGTLVQRLTGNRAETGGGD